MSLKRDIIRSAFLKFFLSTGSIFSLVPFKQKKVRTAQGKLCFNLYYNKNGWICMCISKSFSILPQFLSILLEICLILFYSYASLKTDLTKKCQFVVKSIDIYRMKGLNSSKSIDMSTEYVLLNLAFLTYNDSYILIMPSLVTVAILNQVAHILARLLKI